MKHMSIIDKMKKIVHIGVTLTHGCDVVGGEHAIDLLATKINFDADVRIDQTLLSDEMPLYLRAIVDLNIRLKNRIRSLCSNDEFPLVFGGDHALAIGSIAASQHEDLAVLWIDAHGDCNTDESSITQRIHGMPLAVVQGYGHPQLTSIMDHYVKSNHVLALGLRDLDPLEKTLMEHWGVNMITMSDIETNGLDWCILQIQTFLAKHAHVHCSYDCDSMDPLLIPGVNTPVTNGFNQSQIMQILKPIFQSKSLVSLDIVEFNPKQDNGNTFDLIIKINDYFHKIREEIV